MRTLDYLVVVILLVTAVAIVGLFAMMGELAARVGERAANAEDDVALTPLEGGRLGVRPAWWPEQLSDLRKLDAAAALVLSSVCESCRTVATDLATGGVAPDLPVRFVISCGNREAGLAFLGQTGLADDDRTYLDIEGDWVKSSFGVNISPTLLQFREGTLFAADTLTSAKALTGLAI